MKGILILFFGLSSNIISTSDMIFNFGSGQNQINNWVLISDNIMGGVSKSNLEYTDNTYTYTVEDSAAGNYKDYTALAASIADNSSVLISSNLVKINVQCYEYNITSPNEIPCWWIFNENPVNNNIYGERDSLGSPQPRFLQDDAEETKAALGDLLLFPNGPYTSKNYEGTPVNINNVNAFADGLFENNIYVLEEDKTKSFYEANCSIDFEDNGSFTKQRTPQIVSNGKNTVSFSKTRRLKITKIRKERHNTTTVSTVFWCVPSFFSRATSFFAQNDVVCIRGRELGVAQGARS
jgi:hypothetical protein